MKYLRFSVLLFALPLLFQGEANANAIPLVECSKTGPDSMKTLIEYSLYREFFKQKNYGDAVAHWRYVFLNAPAYKKTTHKNGSTLYAWLISKEKDPSEKALLMDTLMMIYDQRMSCFGQPGFVLGRKGFDMYKFHYKDKEATREVLKDAVKHGGNKSEYFILYPYFDLSLKSLKAGKITKVELLETLDQINTIIEYNIANNPKQADKFKAALENVENSIPGDLLNCDEAKAIFQKKYDENPDDLSLLKRIYNSFRAARCTEQQLFLDAAIKYNKAEPNTSKAKVIAAAYVKRGEEGKAIKYLKQALNMETDAKKKAKLSLDIASIYYKQKDFPTSRSFARAALQHKPNWGGPYILIGKLYASSGKLCGTGTGFESQRVVWAAIDQWKKAKTIDPSVAAEANKNIAKFTEYAPTKEDVFMHGLTEGADYVVPCWINETTKVRVL